MASARQSIGPVRVWQGQEFAMTESSWVSQRISLKTLAVVVAVVEFVGAPGLGAAVVPAGVT